MENELIIVPGTANPGLAQEVFSYLTNEGHLGIFAKTKIKTFNDGETQIDEISENLRLADIFIIQPTCPPVNENLVQLCLLADACARASGKRVTAVLPYYGYARQDKKVKPRQPISAAAAANMMLSCGVGRVITMDLHNSTIQGMFPPTVPVDNLYSSTVILDYLATKFAGKKLVIVSPDAGGVERADSFAKRLQAHLAMCIKRRDKPNEIASMRLVADIEKHIKDHVAILIDDMVDTAGTLTEAARLLDEAGAEEVYAAAPHLLLSKNAVDRIADSPIIQLIGANTIPLKSGAVGLLKAERIKILPVSKLIGEAIIRSHTGESVSDLFL